MSTADAFSLRLTISISDWLRDHGYSAEARLDAIEWIAASGSVYGCPAIEPDDQPAVNRLLFSPDAKVPPPERLSFDDTDFHAWDETADDAQLWGPWANARVGLSDDPRRSTAGRDACPGRESRAAGRNAGVR